MNCKECGREISEESVFCMYCGTEQDFDEFGPESISEEPAPLTTMKRDELAPGSRESALLTSLKSERWRRFTDPLTISLAGISVVLLIAFLVLLFGRPVWEKNRVSSVPTTETTSEETVKINAPESTETQYLEFMWQYVDLNPGECQDLTSSLNFNNDVAIRWSSSNPSAISVDENGFVTAILPGAAATIEARCIEDEAVYDTIRVLCISKDIQKQINLTYELNGLFDNDSINDEPIVNYLPADRNTELTWDESLLRSLVGDPSSANDGMIQSLRIERVSNVISDSGNPIDFEVFRSPILGIIYKIISIEYLPDDTVTISEYYFRNNGELNCAFMVNDDSYNPLSDSASKNRGDWFYFSGDELVRWHIYDPTTGTSEIAVGAKERTNASSPYSVILYSEAGDEKQQLYDENEKQLINKAYSTYFMVANKSKSYGFSGNVTDEIGMPVQAIIQLMCSNLNDAVVYTFLTDDSGYFQIHTPSNGYQYSLMMEANRLFALGYLDNIGALRSGNDTYLGQIRMTSFPNQQNSFRMLITDAVNEASVTVEDGLASSKLRLSGAEVHIREGYGNTNGEIIQTITSDPFGIATATLETGSYTAEVVMPGYESSVYPILVYPECPTVRFCLPPELKPGEMCIVLTWSDENLDLDAHLFTPKEGQDYGSTEHIWFATPEDKEGNRLENDVTRGFDPEIIRIDNVTDGYYKFYVTDYSNSIVSAENIPELRHSFATVQVYSENGLISTVQVKPGDDSLIWEVFEIRNRTVSHINRYYAGVTDDPWWISEKVTQ